MSTAVYHRRWDKRGSSGATSTRCVTSNVEPHCYGTSWNSVRWNKPLGDRGHASRLAIALDSAQKSSLPGAFSTSATSSFGSQPPSRRFTDTGGVGSSALERTSRFGGSTLSSSKDTLSSYRSPSQRASWTSESSSQRSSLVNNYLHSRNTAKESSIGPSRGDLYNSSRYSSLEKGRSTAVPSRSAYESPYSRRMALSPAPSAVREGSTRSPSTSRLFASATQKQDRPWRVRLADAARLRNVHGDDMGAVCSSLVASRARRSSITSQNSGDELQSSLSALRSYVDNSAMVTSRYRRGSRQSSVDVPTIGENSALRSTTYPLTSRNSLGASNFASASRSSAKYRETPMSRSYSPVRPQEDLYNSLVARYGSMSRDVSPRIRHLLRQSSNDSLLDSAYSRTSLLPKSAMIREGSHEGDPIRRRMSFRERMARHQSRQRSQTREPASDSESTSGAEERAESRERRLRKKRLKRKTHSPAINVHLADSRGDPDGAAFETVELTKSGAAIDEQSNAVKEKELIISSHSPLLAPHFIAAVVSTSSEHEPPPSPEPEGGGCTFLSNSHIIEYDTKENDVSVVAEVVKAEDHPTPLDMGHSGSKNDKETGNIDETAKPRKKLFSFSRKKKSAELETNSNYAKRKKDAKSADADKSDESHKHKSNDELGKELLSVPVENSRESHLSSKIDNAKPNKCDGSEKKCEQDLDPVDTAHLSPHFVSATKAKRSLKYSSCNTALKNATSVDSANELPEVGGQEYSAIAHFNPGRRKKSPAPVPGTWSGPDHEMNISQIKAIEKDLSSNTGNIVTILKTFSFCEAPMLTVRLPKKKVLKEVNTDACFEAFEIEEQITLTRKCECTSSVSKKAREPPVKKRIVRQPSPAISDVSFTFSTKCDRLEKTQHHIKAKSKLVANCCLATKPPSTSVATVEETVAKNESAEMSSGAQVTVLSSPIAGQNYYRCKRRMRATPSKAKRQSMPTLSAIINEQEVIIEEEKKRLSQAALDLEAKTNQYLEHSGGNGSLASVVLEQLRNSDQRPVWRRNKSSAVRQAHGEGGDNQLVLPDRSILEEYVKRKRGRGERLHSEPPIVESEEIRCSPCLSTASELIPASTVRVYESVRNVPYITAPSRSRLSSVESIRPSPPPPPMRDNSKTLDLLSYGEKMLSASYHGLKNSQQNRNQRSSSLTVKPTFVFDAPLSPFEERMQNQAFRLRRSSATSDMSPFSEGDAFVEDGAPTLEVVMQLPAHPRSRQLCAENASVCIGTPITSNFEAAAAAASQPRHERYAAHIPVKGADGGSGRISSASIDSTNSGTLDTASKQVDHMIDQARYRHHQHRSKFKEAIDYLDQIFEDLKKECDTPQDERSRPSRPAPTKTTPTKTTSQKVTPKPAFKTPPANSSTPTADLRIRFRPQPEASRQPAVSQESQSSSTPQPSRAPPLHLQPKVPVSERPPPEKLENSSEDVDVSETIILPCVDRKLRGERLDFTRKWLAGDIKSWASVQPKSDLLLGGLEEEPADYEFDECSIGSCSAEVAAINSMDRKKKKIREVPNIIQNVVPPAKPIRKPNAQQQKYDQPAPIKPQPVRAQPVYGLATSSNAYNFNSFPQPFREAGGRMDNEEHFNGNQCALKRMSSHDQAPERKRSSEGVSWRSTSQETYNTVGSVRSEENAVIRASGAFAQYHPSGTSMRGSVNSLPDAGLIMRTQHIRQPDPILSIDALVAELELNTDEVSVNEKRRSFPTRLEASTDRFHENEQPVNSRQPSRSKKISKTSSVDRGARRVQQQKMAFDEMANMLRNVAGDIHSNEQPRSRKHDQFPPASGTILSPFETINQEKLNPSRVEAIQSMFESKQGAPTWRLNVSHGRRPSCEEDTYYEINEFTSTRKERSPLHSRPIVKPTSPTVRSSFAAQPQQQRRNAQPGAALPMQPAQHDFVPAFPITQPPSHPPGSANSSQTGGYYSSGSSLGAPSSYAPSHQHSSLPRSSASGTRGSLIGKQSTSSRPGSFEDEDDGFYDNIPINERRFSRGSEVDNTSMNSHRPPPNSKVCGGTRLGQFLRKIGSSKPPVNAASLMSLNTVANENMLGHAPLMKSNSLSNEPWKTHIIGNPKKAARNAPDKRAGLGQRLKNSIFGSKKRLD
uniref:Supervillin n=1 Tax=Parascaris univalens TaxID=6257 RepID=A0A915C4M7_PARUN